MEDLLSSQKSQKINQIVQTADNKSRTESEGFELISRDRRIQQSAVDREV